MKKSEIKYIRQIADRLPPVYEQSVSGFYEDFDEEGKTALFPNVVNHEINHVRRMRKAYERLGMEGIKQYLDMIHRLQLARSEQFKDGLRDTAGEDIH